jgi:ankyrin repeat protein
VKARSDRGATPLHFTADVNGASWVATLLINSGADVNARDNLGKTPLHWVAENQESRCQADRLIERGADVHARDDSGKTALDYALANGYLAVANVLRIRGTELPCDPNAPDRKG